MKTDIAMTGVSLTADGSNVDTKKGGYAQHILFLNNTYGLVSGATTVRSRDHDTNKHRRLLPWNLGPAKEQ